jgi:N-acylneuraminate cytidylyltransferase
MKYKKLAKICLICCRGGSKKIKNKNIKNFCNKSLLSWSLKNILKSKIFDRVILSTDSKKIFNVGKKFKIEVPGLRPKKLSTSYSNQFDTHKYIFKKLDISDKNSIVCVFNNNPFISADLIIKSFNLFKKNKYEGLVVDSAIVSGDYIAPKQFNISKNRIFYFNKKHFLKLKLNRQSLKKYYTNIYNLRWGKPSFLENFDKFKKQIVKNNNKYIFLKKIQNFDLDDAEDWQIAEAVFKCNEKKFL